MIFFSARLSKTFNDNDKELHFPHLSARRGRFSGSFLIGRAHPRQTKSRGKKAFDTFYTRDKASRIVFMIADRS